MYFSLTVFRRYTRGLALLASVVGTALFCAAAPKTWTISGTFTDGGTVNGTFVFDPDTNTFGAFNITVSGGNTSVFFPFTWTPTNAVAEGPFTGEASQIAFVSNAAYPAYANNEPYVLQFVPTTPLTDAGGAVSINTSSGYSGNCFDCNPYRAFASASISGPVSSPTPPATPAPPTLLLIMMGLACAGAYAVRDRFRQAFNRN